MFHKIFRNQKVSIFIIALIFLPGTIIHEFAHAIVAKILFVHVGKMTFMPQLSGESLKLGSVEVGRSDIIRNLLIGIAPFLVGTSLLLGVLYFAVSNLGLGFNLITVVVLLFTFMISNTMYSSKKDLEGALGFFALVAIFIFGIYFFGIRIPGLSWETFNNEIYRNYFQTGAILLGIPVIIDILIIFFSKFITKS